MPILSVIVPIYNEAEALPHLAARLRPALDDLSADYEVVAVDDGSRDATPAVLAGMRRDWPQLRVVRLYRNSGHQAALTAGVQRAFGDYLVSIDADLQDPPEKIADMLALARRDKLDVVYGVRSDRATDTAFKRMTAAGYYRTMRRLVGFEVASHAGDFRLLSRAAVDALNRLPEHRPVYRLLVPWLGFPSGEVSYVREARVAGRTKYPFTKMARLALDSLTSFSALPLRLATWIGLISIVVCLVMIIRSMWAYTQGDTVSGWASLIVVVTFLGGGQLICLGLLGEYVGRIYSGQQNRPTFFIAHDTGAAPEPPAETPSGEIDSSAPSSR